MTNDGRFTRRLPALFYGSRGQNVAVRILVSAVRPVLCSFQLARRMLTLGIRLLLPRICLNCPAAAERSLGLCTACRRLLLAPPPASAAADRPAASDAFFWLWSYEPPLDQVIHGLKYRGLHYLGHHIAEEFEARLGPELERADVVVPMPMHWRRRLARSRNHAESIARPLARSLDRPLLPALRRRTSGRPQAGLSRRQRLANPAVTFTCRRPAAVRGLIVLLVDDVVTTGATAGHAARCLKSAGAAEVIVAAAARTPATRSS